MDGQKDGFGFTVNTRDKIANKNFMNLLQALKVVQQVLKKDFHHQVNIETNSINYVK